MRPTDRIDPLENYHNKKPVYVKSYLENTYPEHYYPEHVKKGSHKTLDFNNSGTIKAYDKEEAEKYGSHINL